MGDRTIVILTLEREAYERIKNEPWFDDGNMAEDLGSPLPGKGGDDSRSITTAEALVAIQYEEVNYGDLDFLEELASRGIAFTSEWASGGNYGPGSTTFRFNAEGEAQFISIMDGEQNPPIGQLMQLIDDPQALAFQAPGGVWPHLPRQAAPATQQGLSHEPQCVPTPTGHRLCPTQCPWAGRGPKDSRFLP